LRHIHSKALQYARYLTVNMRLNFSLSTAMRPNARISCAKSSSGPPRFYLQNNSIFSLRHSRESGNPSPDGDFSTAVVGET
jgi:hypothetical protein